LLRFLADICFSGAVYRGIKRHNPLVDIVRAQDVGMDGAPDPLILAWAAENGRLVLSHDVNTLIGYANDRTRSGQPMPGLVEVPHWMAIGAAVEDILILAECSDEHEWDGQIIFLPL
jgi:hypothetical protein